LDLVQEERRRRMKQRIRLCRRVFFIVYFQRVLSHTDLKDFKDGYAVRYAVGGPSITPTMFALFEAGTQVICRVPTPGYVAALLTWG
jgi:hypothetical protein